MPRVDRLGVAATFAALAVATGVPVVAELFGFVALLPAPWPAC